MNRMIRTLLALLAVMGLVFALAGCAQPTPEPTEPPVEEPVEEVEEEVFKLGVMGPFSGPNALTGDQFRGAVEMAFENIDYKIGHYNIELVWIDSQSDPAKATQAYEEAVVQKGIQAGLGNWHSSVAVACMEVTAKHKIPHFFALGATDVVNETWKSDPDKYFYWAAKGWPEPGLLTTSYVQALEDAIAQGLWTPESKTVAIWGEETDWARSFATGMKAQLEGAGWEVVSEDFFPLDQTEFVPLLTRLKELNPALFAGTGSAAPLYSALIKQADEVGLESIIIADGLGWVGEWYDLTGDASNYVMDQIPGREVNMILLEVFNLAAGQVKMDILTLFGKRRVIDAVPVLLELIKPKKTWEPEGRISLQEKICRTLGEISSPEAAETLIAVATVPKPWTLLKAKPDSIREAATLALRQLPDKVMIRKALDVLKGDKSPLLEKPQGSRGYRVQSVSFYLCVLFMFL